MDTTILKEIIEKPITGEWGSEGERIKVLRSTNFSNDGLIDFKNLVSRNIPEHKIESKKLKKGDVIIEKSGGGPNQPVGRVVYFDLEEEFICNNFTSILRPLVTKVFPKYLHYLLFASHKFGLTQSFQNKTTGIINLQLSRYVNKLEIPLPPLKTQKRIAQILDDAATLRDKTKQLLDEYDLLAQSIFLEMFGDPVTNPKKWVVSNMKEVAQKVQIGPFGSQLHKADYIDNGFALINPTNIINGKIDLSKVVFINKEKFNSLPNYHLKSGDILMARRGDLRKISLVDRDNYFCGTGSLYIRLDKNINSLFALFLLSHKSTIDRLYSKSRGITMANLNKKIIYELKIVVPPIQLQNLFAEKIALIEKQKALAKQELKESEDLFNCLLQKAFNGELV